MPRPFLLAGFASINAKICGTSVNRLTFWMILLLASSALSSCGYRVLTAQDKISLSSLHVAGVRNETHEPGLEDILHQALVEELLTDRRVGLVAEGGAGVLLKSTLKRFNLRATAESEGRVTQYEIELEGDFLLVDGKTGETVMEIRNLRAPIRTTFTVGSDVAVARINQERAEAVACRSLARELASRVLLN